MKASDVLNLYATGKRDFRRETLRGQNFQGKDLSGADFSGCDIRGANFKNANLTGAKFIKAKAGLQKNKLIDLIILAFILIIFSTWCATFASFLVTLIFDHKIIFQVGGWTISILLIFFCIINFYQGLRGGIVTIILAGGIAIAIAMFFTLAGIRAKILDLIPIFLGIVVIIIATNKILYITNTLNIIVTLFLILLSAYLGWRAMRGNPKEVWLRSIAVTFAATDGTSFYEANLTNADFTGATLKNTDLRAQSLTRTCFKDTVKLNFARVGKTLLSQPAVRDLLINPSIGYKKDYFKADLRGANLGGASLKEANLKQADLSEASLRGADLSHANLTEVNAINTDFTRAYLTGACLEAWNIDTTTKLDNVDCQYVFLLEHLNEHGSREHRPSSGDFQPGEFTKLFEEVFDTVDLIFRNGIDWKAFIAAMKQVQVQNEDTPLEIQSIENKGDGVVVVKVNVPPGTNKEKIHQDFNQNYSLALEAVEAKYKAQLAAKDNEITIYRQQNIDMIEITKTLANRPINVEAKAMTNSSDSSKKIEAGRDVNISDSVVNLADTISEVTNAINLLPDATDSQLSELKTHLQQLQTAIESETNLDDDEKSEALNQVKKLADLGKTPEDEGLQKKAKKAVSFLEIIAKGLEPATKLAQACKNVLPIITSLLGF